MLDPEGTVASWNAGAERIKGYAAHEIVGKKFSEFFTPEDREGRRARAARCAWPARRAATKAKAGVCARTEAGSGRSP